MLGACSNDDVALGSQDQSSTKNDASAPDGSAVSSCQAAGGSCLASGGDPCLTHAPANVDDCNPDLTPAGSFCCLDTKDSCRFDSEFEPLDAGYIGRCTAARDLLSCVTADLTYETCISEDPTSCPSSEGEPDAPFTCTDKCAAGEYAVSCGGIGESDAAAQPTGCRDMGTTPGGATYYCCQCGI